MMPQIEAYLYLYLHHQYYKIVLLLHHVMVQKASRYSEHPPVRAENVKTLGGIIDRLQMQNLFMAFKWVLRWFGSNVGSTV